MLLGGDPHALPFPRRHGAERNVLDFPDTLKAARRRSWRSETQGVLMCAIVHAGGSAGHVAPG